MADHCRYSASGISRYAIHNVRRPSVAYSWKKRVSACGSHSALTYLQVCYGSVRVRLIWTQTFQDDGVGSFAIQLDPAIGTADHCGHSFPRGVELANVEDFVFLTRTLNVDEDRLGFSGLWSTSQHW